MPQICTTNESKKLRRIYQTKQWVGLDSWSFNFSKLISCSYTAFFTSCKTIWQNCQKRLQDYIGVFILICFRCWSNGIGRNGNGKQQINLANGCWGHGTIVHEIGKPLLQGWKEYFSFSDRKRALNFLQIV